MRGQRSRVGVKKYTIFRYGKYEQHPPVKDRMHIRNGLREYMWCAICGSEIKPKEEFFEDMTYGGLSQYCLGCVDFSTCS